MIGDSLVRSQLVVDEKGLKEYVSVMEATESSLNLNLESCNMLGRDEGKQSSSYDWVKREPKNEKPSEPIDSSLCINFRPTTYCQDLLERERIRSFPASEPPLPRALPSRDPGFPGGGFVLRSML